MQTYSHALFGACLGAYFFPQDHLSQAACVFGSVLPDVVQIPAYIVDRLRGMKPLLNVSDTIVLLKNITHSIVLWSAGLLAVFTVEEPFVLGFVLGGLTHALTDALTHCDPKYQHDAGFLWPSSTDLSRYTGIWDYRIDHGVLRPKLPEAILDAILIVLIIFAWAK